MAKGDRLEKEHSALTLAEVLRFLVVASKACDRFGISSEEHIPRSMAERKLLKVLYTEIAKAHGQQAAEVIAKHTPKFLDETTLSNPEVVVKHRRGNACFQICRGSGKQIRKGAMIHLPSVNDVEFCSNFNDLILRVEKCDGRFDFRDIRSFVDCVCAISLAWLLMKLAYWGDCADYFSKHHEATQCVTAKNRDNDEATQGMTTKDRDVPTPDAPARDRDRKKEESPQPPPAPK